MSNPCKLQNDMKLVMYTFARKKIINKYNIELLTIDIYLKFHGEGDI